MKRVEAHAIAELGGMFDIPYGQIGAAAWCDDAAIIKAERSCGVVRYPCQCFFWREFEERAAHIHGHQQGCEGGRAGIGVRR